MGVNSRAKGHAYERKIITEMWRWFPDVVSSRSESKRADDKMKDLMYTGKLCIQCKATETSPSYSVILKQMKINFPNETPLIFRKQNRKLYRGSRNHIRNQASRYVYGFCRWDKVRYSGGEYLIRGRRASGYFSLSDIRGKPCVVGGRKLDSVKYSNLTLLERSKTLIGRRNAAFLPAHRAGFPAAN